MYTRPLCRNCRTKLAAINYKRKGITHYRSNCDTCISAIPGKKKRATAWQLAGYKKKPQCEQCGFKSVVLEQMVVFHIDGNLKNSNWANLKTVCANCAIAISVNGHSWTTIDIKPDY